MSLSDDIAELRQLLAAANAADVDAATFRAALDRLPEGTSMTVVRVGGMDLSLGYIETESVRPLIEAAHDKAREALDAAIVGMAEVVDRIRGG